MKNLVKFSSQKKKALQSLTRGKSGRPATTKKIFNVNFIFATIMINI